MVKDSQGTEVKVGDVVNISAEIKEIREGDGLYMEANGLFFSLKAAGVTKPVKAAAEVKVQNPLVDPKAPVTQPNDPKAAK